MIRQLRNSLDCAFAPAAKGNYVTLGIDLHNFVAIFYSGRLIIGCFKDIMLDFNWQ